MPIRQILSFAAAAIICLLSQTEALAAPRAVIDHQEYNFGIAWQGDTVVHIFKLKNAGNDILKMENLKITGKFTTIMMKKTLPPGEEMKITMIMDTPGVEGEGRTGAILFTNDPQRPEIEIKMWGQVKPMLTVEPMAALYFSVYQGDSKEKDLEINNHYEKSIRIIRVEQDSSRFQAQLQTIKDGQKYRLQVKVNPQAPPGRTMEKVSLVTDNDKRPKLEIGVNIFIKQDVYVFPEKVDFGRVSLEQLRKKPENLNPLIQTVQIKRRETKGQDFQIRLASDLPQIAIRKDPESHSATYRLDVSLVPDKLSLGKVDSAIRVSTNDPEVPEVQIPVAFEVE